MNGCIKEGITRTARAISPPLHLKIQRNGIAESVEVIEAIRDHKNGVNKNTVRFSDGSTMEVLNSDLIFG